jgi:hypothetical protein
MNARKVRRRLRRALVVVAAVAASCCGSSPITSARLEPAIEATFANLVQVQVSWLGMRPMTASEFEVTASCRKLIAGGDSGAGEWVCRLRWLGPNGQPLRDAFDVSVATDGCYTATASGENLGGPSLKRSDGRDVRNLLYVFEGCFDTT